MYVQMDVEPYQKGRPWKLALFATTGYHPPELPVIENEDTA